MIVEAPADAGTIAREVTCSNRTPTKLVDNASKAQNASYIGVYIREGIKYREVVKALDLLRKTTAKGIAVSMIELSGGAHKSANAVSAAT